MIALTVVMWIGFSLQLALGLAIGIAIGILIAHLGSLKVKRFAAAVVIAAALATSIGVVARASDDDSGFVMLNPCKGLTPSDWDWWVRGCMWP